MLKYSIATIVLAVVIATTLVFTADSQATGNLIGQWNFDDGTATDSSGNGHDGVVNGAIPTIGQFGTDAMDFDGIDDFVNLGNLDVPGSALTVAAWINADNFTNCGFGDCRIVSKADGVREADHYIMLSTINSSTGIKLRFRLKAGGSTSTLISNSTALSEGQWTHVAGTYDGSEMRVFINGVEEASAVKTGVIDTDPTVPFWIGGNPSGPASRPWNGKIDEVRLYDGALDASEMLLLLAPEPTPEPTLPPVPTNTPEPPTPVPTATPIGGINLILEYQDDAGSAINEVVLDGLGASTDVQLHISGLTSTAVNVAQISITHDPSLVSITHSCEGLFGDDAVSSSGRVDLDGYSWFICGITDFVTESSGQIMNLTLTRVQAGEPILEFNTGGTLPTALIEPETAFSFDQLGTLLVSGTVAPPTPTPTPTAVPATLTPRTGHSATLLSDGTILIVGGIGQGGLALLSAEILDPVSGTVTVVGSLTTARAEHSATLENDGRVLIFGGTGSDGVTPLNSIEVFDPATGTFS